MKAIGFLLLLFSCSALAEEKGPVPVNAKVTLSLDKPAYFLGENVLLHYKIENTGGPVFSAEFGFDYRGAARALRFIVSGTDEDGKTLDDPYPGSMCFGGMGGPKELRPGQSHVHSLPIVRYLRFEKPGVYRIKVHHDCGWEATEDAPFPVGEITLQLKRPSKEEAARLVRAWLAAPEDPGWSNGEKRPDFVDMSQVRFEEYLEPLAPAAREGNKKAIQGVGSIAFPEATRLLIELAGGDHEDIARLASSQLTMRLPDPYFTNQLGKRNPFEDDMKAPRRYLMQQAWREEFAQPVRDIAVRFLKSPDTQFVNMGAFMMECLGRPAEAPAVVAALSRAAEKTLDLKLDTRVYPRPRGACMELQRAAKMLIVRGAPAPEQPASPGEALLFLNALKEQEGFRPEGWVQTCERLLEHRIPYLREITLKSLPEPMPRALHKHLAPILAAGDVDASIAACRIIERDKLAAFKEPMLKVLGEATESWLFNGANNAALAIADGYDRFEVLVERLDEPDMLFLCLDAMKSMYSNTGGGGHNSNQDLAAAGRAIQPKWRDFIKKHKESLEEGKKFKLPHPDVSPDMVPEGYHITLQPKGDWP